MSWLPLLPWLSRAIAMGSSLPSDNWTNARSFGYGYDSLGRMTFQQFPWDSIRFTYNADGSMVTSQGRALTTYGYDIENHLTGIPAFNFTAAYGADDLRAYKTQGSATTYYLTDLDGSPFIEETFSGGSATITQVHGYAADGQREAVGIV